MAVAAAAAVVVVPCAYLSCVDLLNLLVELVDVGREAFEVRDDELMAEGAGNQDDVVNDQTVAQSTWKGEHEENLDIMSATSVKTDVALIISKFAEFFRVK